MNWKKSLGILATMPAYAFVQSAPASNVQIYGRLDVGVNFQKFAGESVKAATVTSDTSLFGFRGIEQIDKEVAAYFKLENGFQLDSGAFRRWYPDRSMGIDEEFRQEGRQRHAARG
jgi:predicted porin